MKGRMLYLILPVLLILALVVVLATLSALATRPKNLGLKDGRLAPCPSSPNCVSTQADDAPHRMEPIPFSGSLEDAMQRLKSAIASMPRMRIVTEAEDYLHVEATSRVFRFVDDIEFFVDKDNKALPFRSASRVGRSDFGANRKRMEAIRRAFKREA